MAEAFLEVLLQNLSSLIQKEVGLFLSAEKDMKRLSRALSTIQAVLEDAEEKQLSDRAIRDWLHKLKDEANHLDNVLDVISTEARRLEYQGLKHGPVSTSRSSFLSSLHPKNVLFRCKIAKKMKDIGETLDEIAQERIKFHFSEAILEKSAQVMEWRETTSIIAQSQVYGRDVEKKKVIDFLIDDAFNSKDLSIYTIVGIGGLGKTTLAQLVFNDDKISDHFELKIWVSVSKDFSLKTLLKAIAGHAYADMNLESLQTQVQEKLQKTRYLLVLDDVWNEDQDNWDRLKYILACGSKGASIVVTTRLLKVASIMGTWPTHELSEDCWSLFKERAFGMGNKELSELVPLGKEIVKKCGGVPLAAKALGGLLRFKNDRKEWLYIKENKLWDLSQSQNSILAALRLSYMNLPLNLRQCFAYCAIFPKDFLIEKDLLIHLWIANGFISSSGMLMVEDIGDQVCSELCWRSLFQDIERDVFGNIVRFKMHDLVHDLAQWIMVESCCITDDYSISDLSGRTILHLSFYHVDRSHKHLALSLHQLQSLRTYMFIDYAYHVTAPDLVKFYYLRVLHLRGLNIVPYSICHLKHLRYLNLSQGDLKILPKAICSLWNLQILNLDYCLNLQELPKNMKCLKVLRHLLLKGCISLSSMPPRLGQLTSLRTLNIFIVSNSKRVLPLAELKYLKLNGELHIKNLEQVTTVMDAKEANLSAKQLDRLSLSWRRNGASEIQENVQQILEALEPHSQLKHLWVGGYKGEYFPNWMCNPTLKYLHFIEIVDCKNCLRLPALGKLPSLKRLRIHYMDHVRFIDDESYDGTRKARGFNSLQHLVITHLPNLEGLSKEEGEGMFSSLSQLEISQCPKLSLPKLHSVTEIVIDEDPTDSRYTMAPRSLLSSNDLSTRRLFLHSITNLQRLQGLWLNNDEDLTLFPDGMLQGLSYLKKLQIQNYAKLETLPTDLSHLHALQQLEIHKCYSLVYFPELLRGLHSLETLKLIDCCKLKRVSTGFQYLTSLKFLTIDNCLEMEDLEEALQHVPSLQSLFVASLPNLEPFPDWLENLTSLESLAIHDCRRLVSLPMSIRSLTGLKKLAICCCPELSKRYMDKTREDWHEIAHIPHIDQKFPPLGLTNRVIYINHEGI